MMKPRTTLKSAIMVMLMAIAACSFVACSSDDAPADGYVDNTPDDTELQAPDEPTTDQLAVKTDKTLYFVADYDLAPKRDVNVLSCLLNRFAEKKTISNLLSLADMQEGDYLIVDGSEVSAISANEELKAAVTQFYQKGGVLLFHQMKAENIQDFFKAIDVTIPINSDNDDDAAELHVYFQPTSCPTLYTSHYENIDAAQAENITERRLGEMADAIISEVKSWVEDIRTPSVLHSLTRAGEGLADINNLTRSYSASTHNSYTFYNGNYEGHKLAGDNGRTDNFDFFMNVWAVKSDTDDRYFYVEISQNLAFRPAYVSEYKKAKGAKLRKVNEWCGHTYHWNVMIEGADQNNVSVLAYNPKTTEHTTSYTKGVTWSVGGTGTLGYNEAQGGSASGSMNVGLSINSSSTWTVDDVEYVDETAEQGRNQIGGDFKLKEAEAHYAAGNYGLVSITQPAAVAKSTFSPAMAFIVKVDGTDPNKDNVRINFSYAIQMVSYCGWSNGSSGEMDKYFHNCDGNMYVDLSGINYQ